MSAVEKMLRRTSRNTSGEQITRKVLRRWVLTALITNVGTLSYVSSVEARMCHIDSRLVGEWDNKDATPNQSITKAGKNDDWIKLEFYCVSRNPQEDQWKSESVIIGVKDIRKTNQANTIGVWISNKAPFAGKLKMDRANGSHGWYYPGEVLLDLDPYRACLIEVYKNMTKCPIEVRADALEARVGSDPKEKSQLGTDFGTLGTVVNTTLTEGRAADKEAMEKRIEKQILDAVSVLGDRIKTLQARIEALESGQ